MIALGNITDTTLNFKIGNEQVHSIWSGEDLIWPMDNGLLFINANWRVVPPWPVFARVLLSAPGQPIIWTSRLFTITSTGCMNFGVSGPYPNDTTQYFVQIRKPDTPGDPERNIQGNGNTAGYGICPANEYLEIAADGGQVFISGQQAYQGYPQLVFDIFNVS